VTGLALAAASPWIGHAFTSDPAVLDQLTLVLVIAALFQPLCGVVFVLDGVLIGAGDGRYLAFAGALVLVAYAPFVVLWHPSLAAVWTSFSLIFMGGRFVVLTLRARRDTWMSVGATA
jgi:Na+-driven multidrug efflux pump